MSILHAEDRQAKPVELSPLASSQSGNSRPEIVADSPRASSQSEAAAAWARHAAALAAWTNRSVVNRRDVYGRYLPEAKRTEDRSAITAWDELTLAVIQRHFVGASEGDLIGLHSTVRDEPTGEGESATCWSKWLAIDIDRHDEATDPEVTRKAAVTWHDAIEALGFAPLLLDSNGRGGYHLVILFDGPVVTTTRFRRASAA